MKRYIFILATLCLSGTSLGALGAPQEGTIFLERSEGATSLPAVRPIIWGNVPRWPNGDQIRMSRREAEEYCQSAGGRLPTVKECAELAVSEGAQGIRKTAFPHVSFLDARIQAERSVKKKSGYYAMFLYDQPDRLTVGFYYNKRGYKASSSGDASARIWTSDRYPDPDGDRMSYVFFGDFGYFSYGFDEKPIYETVRCVKQK